MILTGTPAGEGMKLWAGGKALKRSDWEDSVVRFLASKGYQRVYTPHVCTKGLTARYDQHLPRSRVRAVVLRDVEGERRVAGDDEEKYLECVGYDYLPPKNPMHVAMMAEGQKSYRDLPERFFEIGESYSYANGVVVNEPGIWLTTACTTKDQDAEATRTYATVLGCHFKPMYSLASKVSKAESEGQLLYTSDGGTKLSAVFVFGWATFQLSLYEGVVGAGPPSACSPAAVSLYGGAIEPNEHEIRHAAYLDWEQAGRPPGDGRQFWVEAERRLRLGL